MRSIRKSTDLPTAACSIALEEVDLSDKESLL
jgi:hypothetical protein